MKMRMTQALRLLPTYTAVLIVVTCVGAYIAAVWQSHVQGAVPYISDAATTAPESCVFGELINLANVLLAGVTYVRYLQVCELFERHKDLHPRVATINSLSIWVAVAIFLGLSVVANVQRTNMFYTHSCGGFVFFAGSVFYMFLQACSTFYMSRYTGSVTLARVRFACFLISLVSLLMLVGTLIMARRLFDGPDNRIWFPEDGGYVYHVISTTCEWITVFVMSYYIHTFSNEFRYLQMISPRVLICQECALDGVLVLSK